MQKEIARHKNAQDQREPRKIGLNINNPEIKGTALIYKYPDGKEGLDSANIYWLRKWLSTGCKSDLDSARKDLKKALPHTIDNQWSIWWG